MDYSPILAVVTAAFEIVVAVCALRGPGERSIVRTASTLLLLLAAYQIAEVAICANVTAAGFTPRLAFVIVTWLPALGVLLIAQLLRPRSRAFTASTYGLLAAAAAIVLWIVVDRSFASASVCNAVYARYTHIMPQFLVYSSFYCLGLLGMVVFSGYGAMICRNPRRQRQLLAVFVSTVAFVALGVLTSQFVPPARGALPSIMCHYALLFAFGLTRLIHLERKRADASALARAVGNSGK